MNLLTVLVPAHWPHHKADNRMVGEHECNFPTEGEPYGNHSNNDWERRVRIKSCPPVVNDGWKNLPCISDFPSYKPTCRSEIFQLAMFDYGRGMFHQFLIPRRIPYRPGLLYGCQLFGHLARSRLAATEGSEGFRTLFVGWNPIRSALKPQKS